MIPQRDRPRGKERKRTKILFLPKKISEKSEARREQKKLDHRETGREVGREKVQHSYLYKYKCFEWRKRS